MNRRLSLAALLVAVLGFIAPGTAVAATGSPEAHVVAAKHACTRTSSGSCIRGGEFCKQSQYNHSGWSATGKRYVCKGNRTHPHWELP